MLKDSFCFRISYKSKINPPVCLGLGPTRASGPADGRLAPATQPRAATTGAMPWTLGLRPHVHLSSLSSHTDHVGYVPQYLFQGFCLFEFILSVAVS